MKIDCLKVKAGLSCDLILCLDNELERSFNDYEYFVFSNIFLNLFWLINFSKNS